MMRGFRNPLVCMYDPRYDVASPDTRVQPYLEYSSTTRLSLIVEGRSERAGSALNVPFISFALTSIHSGKPRVSAAATEPLTRRCSFVLGATSTVSPGRTW